LFTWRYLSTAADGRTTELTEGKVKAMKKLPNETKKRNN